MARTLSEWSLQSLERKSAEAEKGRIDALVMSLRAESAKREEGWSKAAGDLVATLR